jgi:hypothetical protein
VPKSVLLEASGVSPETFNLRLRSYSGPTVKVIEVLSGSDPESQRGPCEVNLGNWFVIRVPLDSFAGRLSKLMKAS